jgi:hypothetical protein
MDEKILPYQFEINFADVLSRCMRSIERALTFRQFAVHGEYNLDNINDFRSHIEPAMTWRLSKPVVADQFDLIKSAYVDWAVGNCVREIIEGLYLFIDEVALACNLTAKYKGKPFKRIQLDKEISAIRKATKFSEKLSILRRNITLSPERERYLHSLNRIRNCLSHHGGIATEHGFPDCTNGERIVGEWLTTKFYLFDPKMSKKSKLKFGVATKNETDLIMKIEKKLKTVPDRQQVTFTFDELNEISFTVQQIANDIINQAAITLIKTP